MLAISARIELDPASVDTYLEAAQPVVSTTRTEKGCTRYAIARDIVEPNIIWISEEWDSDEDLEAHLRSDHITKFLEITAELGIRSMDIQKYEVSSAGPLFPAGG